MPSFLDALWLCVTAPAGALGLGSCMCLSNHACAHKDAVHLGSSEEPSKSFLVTLLMKHWWLLEGKSRPALKLQSSGVFHLDVQQTLRAV